MSICVYDIFSVFVSNPATRIDDAIEISISVLAIANTLTLHSNELRTQIAAMSRVDIQCISFL